jgi:hypothetical protein
MKNTQYSPAGNRKNRKQIPRRLRLRVWVAEKGGEGMQTDTNEQSRKYTQETSMLKYFKLFPKGIDENGITAREITSQLWIHQYNYVIKKLREKGHVIDSVREKDPVSGKVLYKFYYRGQSAAPPAFTME